MTKFCICGAGTMGSGIAQVTAMAGFPTLLFDVSEEAVQKAAAKLKADLEKLVEKGRLSPAQQTGVWANLRFVSTLDQCNADVVIEAIVEKLSVKVELFRQLAALNGPQTIFASNTSSLSITALAEALPHPERVAGLHFFNPAPLMKLVEVVRGHQTADSVVTQLVALTNTLGKVPVVCNDSPGFIVNRVARPFYIESLRLAEAGAATYDVMDRLLESVGFKMGPFKLMDLIGNDVNYAVSCSVYEQLGGPERLKPSYLQKEKVEKGELGKKTGKGYYDYSVPLAPKESAASPTPPREGLATTQASLVEAATKQAALPHSKVTSGGHTRLVEQGVVPPGDGGVVFVTGGTGFLGAYIIKNLVEKGLAVRALRRSASVRPFFIPPSVWEKVEWVDGDVLDVVALQEGLQGVAAVVHSAAIVSFSKDNRDAMYKVNIDGTANVVNMALEAGVKRLLHVSSVAALGRTGKVATVTEEKKWAENASNTHYAITKHQAEMHAWRGFAEGLSGVIINPSTILGFGNWHQSSVAIFKNAYKEFPWYTTGVNGFVGVEDAAEATVQLLLSNITEKRFIVSAENRSFQSLFTTIAQGFGKRPPHRQATKFMGEVAWRLEALKGALTGTKPLLSKETAKIAQSQTSFDNSALLQALPGFRFQPLDTVIQKACGQYLQAMKAGELTL